MEKICYYSFLKLRETAFGLIAMTAVVLAGCLLVSCGSDDDDGTGGGNSSSSPSFNLTTLIGKTYKLTKETYDNQTNYEATLLSPYFALIHKYGRYLDPDVDKASIWSSWDQGEYYCLYTCSGNQVTISYDKNTLDLGEPELITWTIANNQPEGWDYQGKTSHATSTETFDARQGTPDIYGYYSCDVLRNSCEEQAQNAVRMGAVNKNFWQVTFPDFTRHFFSSLAETVDSCFVVVLNQ